MDAFFDNDNFDFHEFNKSFAAVLKEMSTLPNFTPGKCAVCSVSCESRCSRCKTAFYCSTEHQKTDLKKHKGPCITKFVKSQPWSINGLVECILDHKLPSDETVRSEYGFSNCRVKTEEWYLLGLYSVSLLGRGGQDLITIHEACMAGKLKDYFIERYLKALNPVPSSVQQTQDWFWSNTHLFNNQYSAAPGVTANDVNQVSGDDGTETTEDKD